MATLLEAPASAGLTVCHSWIGNREVAGRAGTRPVVSPSSGAAFAEVSLLARDQALEAVGAARTAQRRWWDLGFHERGRHLLEVRERLLRGSERLARLIAREQGKPAAEAMAVEILPALEALKHLALHAEEALQADELATEILLFAHKRASVRYEPFGVVLVITPWNYPLFLSLSGVATALAAGNTVVLKPAPATTLVGLALGELFRDAGVPEGVLNVVAVDDPTAAALVESPRVAKIVFTGSTATGRKIMGAAAANLTPVVLELGGKDPAVVCRDADLGRAAQAIVWAAFVNSGQTCASVERVYVEAPVAEPFLAQVVEATLRLRTGDPLAGEVELGPLTLERQRRLVEEHVADAVTRGARIETGGQRPEGPGWYYPATVLSGVDHEMRVMREETFGPVLPVMTVADLDEAVRLANDSEYGLTAAVFTRSPETARRLERELEAGVVTVNDCGLAVCGEPTAPWGGVKRSGLGRTHGLAGLREMVQVKYLSRDPTHRPLAWWYPYDREYAGLVSGSTRALHARSFLQRLRHQLGLLAHPRLWRRVHLPSLLKNIDKLF